MNLPYLTMLRPHQWLKNLMIFFPPFLAGQILSFSIITTGIPAFFAFCLVSSSGYLFNDLLDRTHDLHHHKKRTRPIPSGAVTVPAASLYAVLLLLSGLLLAVLFEPQILLLLIVYALISFLYSLWLKNIPVVDLFCISAGFLIRLQAGGEQFHVSISSWLFLTVLLLAVFLSTGKRLNEANCLGKGAARHRTSLALYPDGFLAGVMYMTGGAVLVTYALYALQKPGLVYSVPLCLFGLLRYIMRVGSGESGDPTESLLKDRVLFTVSLAWVLMVLWSIYR